jgi:MYXO-CTERM domain-containing protein
LARELQRVPGVMVACPDCETTRIVRASVFDDGFVSHLTLVSAPFLVLGALGALAVAGALVRRRRSSANLEGAVP